MGDSFQVGSRSLHLRAGLCADGQGASWRPGALADPDLIDPPRDLSPAGLCGRVSGGELKGQLLSSAAEPAMNNVFIRDSDKPVVLEESLLRSVYK